MLEDTWNSRLKRIYVFISVMSFLKLLKILSYETHSEGLNVHLEHKAIKYHWMMFDFIYFEEFFDSIWYKQKAKIPSFFQTNDL